VAIEVPRDHPALRATDPVLGAAWREAVGAAFERWLAGGREVVAFDPDPAGGHPTYFLGQRPR
jgi:hypothetical protein